jgi:hypothetical protein
LCRRTFFLVFSFSCSSLNLSTSSSLDLDKPRHVANFERGAKATILVNKVTWSISSLVKIWKICHCVFLSISLSTI